MAEMLVAYEIALRIGIFVAMLMTLAAAEAVWPRRTRAMARSVRWPGNLAIVALNALTVRVLLPVTTVAVALAGERQGSGLLPALGLPDWAAFIAAFVALDLVIYLQHVLFHAVPGLWRLHRMHHADLDFDVTTGGRFHPLEILISITIKLAAIVALGAPASAVIVFEITLSALAMFNHANLRLPARVDAMLRRVVVTPDMHRVHHSIFPEETNSNYGFNLPWWDRLFGTYRPQPKDGHEKMTIGIPHFRTARDLRLGRMLIQPALRPAGRADITAQGSVSRHARI